MCTLGQDKDASLKPFITISISVLLTNDSVASFSFLLKKHCVAMNYTQHFSSQRTMNIFLNYSKKIFQLKLFQSFCNFAVLTFNYVQFLSLKFILESFYSSYLMHFHVCQKRVFHIHFHHSELIVSQCLIPDSGHIESPTSV